MASVNFKKLKGAGAVKAMLRHSSEDERLIHNHKNPDIDKSHTSDNINFLGLNYDEVCQRYDNRIQELDNSTNKNKRKDRVTGFGLSLTTPRDLPIERAQEYLKDIHELLVEKYGLNNVIASYAHFDELHGYIKNDDGTDKVSRPHLHFYVVPEVNGKLLGKKFSSKGNMQAVNKAIDELSIKKYKVPFMTHEKITIKRSVEQVKALSNDMMNKRDRKISALKKDTTDLIEQNDYQKSVVKPLALAMGI